jgi:hypothetical protein
VSLTILKTRRLSTARLALAAALALGAGAVAPAAILTWDANGTSTVR